MLMILSSQGAVEALARPDRLAVPVNTDGDANNDRRSALLSNRKDGKAKQTDIFTRKHLPTASLLINKRMMPRAWTPCRVEIDLT